MRSFIVVISVIGRKMIPVLVHTIFMVEFIHLIDIDKNKDDETKNGALLRHPETKFKSKETDIIQNIDKQELLFARMSAALAIVIAGYFGIHPPGFVAQVVAFAFGLAASSFFPVILMGIFSKRMNKEGAIAGMITGLSFTASYIIYFKFINPSANSAENWWFGISPEGIGTLGMLFNFTVSSLVSRFTAPPPDEITNMVDDLRIPQGAGVSYHHVES